MSVELSVRICTPLDAEDNELLAGLAMMTMAIANSTAAKALAGDGEAQSGLDGACGQQDPKRTTFFCTGESGHRGRHTYRDFGEPGEVN